MNFEEFLPNELEVQKEVVESLAAEKAEQEEKMASITQENANLKTENGELKSQIASLKAEHAKAGDLLAKNSETEASSKIALLERNPELDDRYLGETTDHVLEVIKEARDAAEKEGRLRRAQILESVLVVNEPVGNLAENRASLEKLFTENSNIINGPVIEELKKRGISHKNGEEYLLTTEIIKRNY